MNVNEEGEVVIVYITAGTSQGKELRIKVKLMAVTSYLWWVRSGKVSPSIELTEMFASGSSLVGTPIPVCLFASTAPPPPPAPWKRKDWTAKKKK